MRTMSASTTRERLAGFAARCRASGLAVTPQRLAIFRHLASTDRHPSAEELHATVRRELPTLSLATVYKTLDTLATVGAVRPVSRLGARGRWDEDRKSTRLNSSQSQISYAAFCLKKKKA